MKKDKIFELNITSVNNEGQTANILRAVEEMKIQVNKIEFIEEIEEQDESLITIELSLKLNNCDMKNDVINKIISEDGVIRVSKKTGGKF